MVSLWDMLTVLAGVLALSGAFTAGKEAGGGVRFLVAIALGAGLGILSTFAVRRMADYLEQAGHLHVATSAGKKNPRRPRLVLLYLAAAAWGIISFILSLRITRSVVGFIFP